MPGDGYIILEIKAKFHKPIYPGKEIYYYPELRSENIELGLATIHISWEDEFHKKLGSIIAICKKVQ